MIKKLMKRWAFARAALRACFTRQRLAAFNAAMDYKTELLKILGLASTATDEEITAALATVEKETEVETETMTAMNAAKADLKTARDEIAALKGQLETATKTGGALRMTAVNAAISRAVDAGQILPASVPAETKALADAADLDGAIAALEKRQPAFNTSPIFLTRPGQSVAVPQAMRDRIAAYNAAIKQVAADTKCSDADAEAAVRANPRFKALVDSLTPEAK